MGDRKYIIFDLDGTLVDSFSTVMAACKRVFETHAPAAMPADSWMESWRCGNLEPMFAELAVRAGMTVDGFRQAYDDAYASDSVTGTSVMAEQYAILTSARERGIGIVVLTNKRQQLAEDVCRRLFAEKEIDVVIGRQGTDPIKPRPVMAERLKACGIDPARQCLCYYGDTDIDRRSAELLKVKYEYVNTLKQ